MSVLDGAGRLVDSRFALAGDAISLNPYLAAGTYRVLVAGGTTDGSRTPDLNYLVQGASASDPIGPRAVKAIDNPVGVGPPPLVVPPAVPPTIPVTPVTPTGPSWIIVPPTDWPGPAGTALRPARKGLPRTFSATPGPTSSSGPAVASPGTPGPA
jgi:hypothetical protein